MLKCVEYFTSVKNKSFQNVILKENFENEDLIKSIFDKHEYDSNWEKVEDRIFEYLKGSFNRDKTANSFSLDSLNDNLEKAFEVRTIRFEKKYKDDITTEISEMFKENLNTLKTNILNKVNDKLSVKGLETNPLDDNNNKLFDFTDPIKLTFGIKTYEKYIDNIITNGIFETIFMKMKKDENYEYASFVTSDNKLNKNLNLFKTELWDTIYNYYRLNNEKPRSVSGGRNQLYILENISAEKGYSLTINDKLFVKGDGETSIYYDVMSFIKNEMDKAVSERSNNLKIVRGKKTTLAKAYLSAMILSNFDNYLINNHSDMVSVNMNASHTFNMPSNGNPKYKLNFQWGKKIKLDNSGISDIEDNKTSIIKLLSNVIPLYVQGKMGRWIPNESGLTIGKSNLDSIGALMNSIDIYEEFEINGMRKPFGEILLDFDKGNITFKTILKILSETDTNRSIYARSNIIRSVYEFLYGANGISTEIHYEIRKNPEAFNNMLNPETVIINHLRNTVKNVYNEINTKGESKIIDFIDLDSADMYKYQDLFHKLEEYWRDKEGTNIIEDIKSAEDYVDFLTDPNKGGMELTEKIKKSFISFLNKQEIDFESEVFQESLKYLTTPSHYDTLIKLDEDGNYTKDKTITEKIEMLINDEGAIRNLGLKDLFTIIDRGTLYNTVTTYRKNSGKNMPTMGSANFSSLMPIALSKRENYFSLNKGLYKRTQILSEIVGEQGPKEFSDATDKENFKVAFIKHFLESRIRNKEFIVQPVNFSDKKSITAIVANTDVTLNYLGKSISKMTSDDLKKEFREAQYQYYNGARSEILKTMATVFGKKVENYTIENLEEDYDELNNIAIERGIQPFELLAEYVSNAFDKNYIEVAKDFHYSIYKSSVNGKKIGLIKVNQFLKGMINIYSNEDLFNIWVDDMEAHFREANPIKNIPLSQINFRENKMSNTNKIKELVRVYGEENIEIVDDVLILIREDGTLTELAKQFLWGKDLLISQYLNATVKDAYLHPTNTDFEKIDNIEEQIPQLVKEENARTTAFTKRMNIFGATMNVIGKGDKGVRMSHKVAFSDDPIAPVFNYTGTTKSEEVMNGGGLNSGIFNLLVIASLPGFNLQKTQKPIATSINEYVSTMLKFATFGITNEEIRKSELSDNPLHVLFKKMHDIPIWDKIDGIDVYSNLLMHEDERGIDNFFTISSIIPDYHIEHNGKIKKLSSVKYVSDNIYKVIFEDNTSYEFEVNTIYDLWQGLGGAYTYSKNHDGSFSESNYSQEAVAALMMWHDHQKTGLDLKDKMIAIYGPNTMVKNGAMNINNSKDVFNEDKKLMYMDFDMSFYGIQLDSHSSTEGSDVNEITQVMSAIAENASTPEYYNLVYGAIENVVERGLEKFKDNITTKDENGNVIIDKKGIISGFIKSINKSDQINNAKAIISSLEGDLKYNLPIDNKAIYKQFISFLISETNAEFIRRRFPGSASVLRMSYGFMQIFENNKGDKYLFNDLLRLFKEQNYELEQLEGESTREYNIRKAKHVLDNDPNFNDELISIRSIRPLDTITLNKDIEINGITITSGTPIVIKDYNQYFSLKEILHAENQNIINAIKNSLETEPLNVFRHYKKARDLKPVDITFEQMFEGSENPIERSIWDSEAFEFKWRLNNTENFENSELYKEFIEYIEKVDYVAGIHITTKLDGYKDIVLKYADRWINRTFHLAKYNKTFKFLSDFDSSENRFIQMFSTNDGTTDNLKYRFNDNYVNYYDIINYKHRNPENIHTNVHRKNFGFDKDYSLSEVSKKLFNLNRSKLHKSRKHFYDLIIQDLFKDTDLYIGVEGLNYEIRDGKLYTRVSLDKVSVNEADSFATEVQIFTNSDGTKRVDEYGKIMYDLPKGARVFRTNKGQEILYISNHNKNTSFEILKEFLEKQHNYDYIQVRDYGYNTVDYILNQFEDNYEKLLVSIRDSINDSELRSVFNNKHKFYKDFKDTIKENLGKYTFDNNKIDKKLIIDEFTKTVRDNQKDVLKTYIGKLTSVKMASFQLSLKSISARIPAQGMQSFMGMDTVGFIDGTDNDVYVSHWQLFLQGSDFDIDKIYMMMYDFKNGKFQGWSPYFNVLNFEKSRNIPLPTGKKYTYFSKDSGFKIKDTNEVISINDKRVFNVDNLLKNYPEIDKFLDKLILTLENLNRSDKEYVYSSDKKFLNRIKKHQSFYSDRGFKNFIVDKMLQVTEDPRNQIAFSEPISFGVYDDLGKALNSNAKPLRNYDGYTSGMQQQINAVGTKVIGIAATGEKIYFSLVKYFGDFYSQNLTEDEIINSNKYFRKHYTINGKEYFLDGTVAGVTVNKTTADLQKKILSDWIIDQIDIDNNPEYLKKGITEEQFKEIVIQELSDNRLEDASLTISAILSLATDNAKELMLSKINAGIDMAGIHLYLIMMGVNPRDITMFMIDPAIKALDNSENQDSFVKSRFKTIEKRIASAIKEDYKKTNILTEFLKIYNDSREIIRLGSYLKVNQGSKATEEELAKILNNLEHTIIDQEKTLLNQTKTSDIWEAIIMDKPYMDRTLIQETFENSKSLIGSNINVYKFFNDTDYQKAVIDYYNLIKSTYNILDVLTSSEHFNSMFKSFAEVDKVMTDWTNKHYLIKSNQINKIIDAVFNKYPELSYTISKHLRYKKSSRLSPELINGVLDYYDNAVIYDFIQKESLTIDVNQIMDLYGLSTIKILSHNMAKAETNPFTKATLKNYQFDPNVTNEPGILTVNTPQTIAVFRQLMEDYIIPNEKRKHTTNGFLSKLVKNNHSVYNMKNRISYYEDVSNWSELEELELGISDMIWSLNSIDNDNTARSYKLPIVSTKSIKGGVTDIELLDLLTLYSLIINENKFGGNRMTNFLGRDSTKPNTISNKFLNHEMSMTHEDVDKIISNITDNPHNIDNFLMYLFKTQEFKWTHGVQKLFISDGQEDEDAYIIRLNRYLTFNYADMSLAKTIKSHEDLVNDLVDSIKILHKPLEQIC